MQDMNGVLFKDGVTFIKPALWGRSAVLHVRVASIRNGKLYGNDSHVPLQYPERCYILNTK